MLGSCLSDVCCDSESFRISVGQFSLEYSSFEIFKINIIKINSLYKFMMMRCYIKLNNLRCLMFSFKFVEVVDSKMCY